MIDLHMHSTFSDGSCTPQCLQCVAMMKHLQVYSITDHDNMDAYQYLDNALSDGVLIPGVEMTFTFKNHCMDMLGYGVDASMMESFGLFRHHDPDEVIKREQGRLSMLIPICKQLGLAVHENLHIQYVHERANDVLCDDLLAYHENVALLKAMGIVNRTTFYRFHYLNPTSVFYMKQETDAPDMNTVANAIHESGGLTFLAHPFVYDVADIWGLLDTLRETGCFDGIECIHRRHQSKQSEALIAYCDQHHLYKSGGSDLHNMKQGIGHGNQGTLPIPNTLIQDWVHHWL